jgi:hypothetical protein
MIDLPAEVVSSVRELVAGHRVTVTFWKSQYENRPACSIEARKIDAPFHAPSVVNTFNRPTWKDAAEAFAKLWMLKAAEGR